MRINHNIAALNTYNKLSANQATTAKSLEKLSSGLKINKAGDNAAGLAISEKMRGQIRGLDQASTNASDAISLINTAEGALSETHSILQRMRELAVQSSNDTNVTVDRSEIQKEMNQLTSEINRIGNTTEFNTQKLLNGGGAATVSGAITPLTAGGKAGAVSTVKQELASNTGKSSVSFVASGKTFTLTGNSKEVDLSSLKIAFNTAGTSGISKTSNTVTITLSNTGTTSGGDVQALLDSSSLFGSGVTFKVTDNTTGADITATNITTNNAAALDVAVSGAFSIATGQEQKGIYSFKITEAFVRSGATIAFNLGDGLTPDSYTAITLTADQAGANSGTGTAGTFNIGGNAATRFTAEVQAENIATALKTGAWTLNGAVTIASKYDVRADGDTIIFTEKAATGGSAAKVSNPVVGGANAAVRGSGTYTHKSVIEAGGSFTVDGVEIEVVDGNGTQDEAKRIQGTAILFTKGDTASGQAALLRDAINSNTSLNTKYAATATTDTIKLVQQAGSESSVIPEIEISSVAGQSFKANFQIGANTKQSLTVEIEDMRAKKLSIAGTESGGSVKSKDNTVTAYYTETTNVTDGTTNDNVEFALDVSTHEKATAAITIINDAIQTVSAERSKLGSYQNRLEHTINNLGTSSENLTSAESRIRDVDMAKEMMEFTKNNILSQAAQSMLAQANQQPQGVLQLLQ